MEISARGRFVRCSTQKARLVADSIRGRRVDESVAILRYSNRKASKLFAKVLASAIANAEENFSQRNVDDFVVSTVFVDHGPTLKRFRPRTMGMASRIRKRTSHITLVISNGKDE